MLVPVCGLGGAVVTLPFSTQKKHWASLGPGNEIPLRMYSGTKAIFCDTHTQQCSQMWETFDETMESQFAGYKLTVPCLQRQSKLD